MNIYKEEQIISVIHERNNHQIKVLASLNKHKKLLEKLAEETTLLESQNNQANKSAIETFGAVACLSIGGLAPPPPPPPPPPPIAGLKISFSQPKPQIESVNAPCQKTNISTAIHTQKTAVSAELKARIIARRNVLEQDMPDNNSFSDKRAAEQEKQKNQQKQEQQATLAKYAEHAKEKFALPFSAHKAECDVRTSAIKIKIQKIDAEIEHLSGDETIAQLTRDLHLLARSPRPLITEAPPRVTDQPAIHKPLIAEVLPRMINQSTVHKPLVEKSQPSLRPQVSILQEKITLSQDAIIKKVQQASTQQQNYLSRVKAIMGQNEITVLKFYLAKNNNMLHVALEKLNPDNLNKAIIIYVLIISNYVERKRLEIKKKKLSPEVGSIYTRSLDAFYKEALSIRLSNENTNVQRIRLEEAANKHFKPRHANFRRFADVFIMIGTLFVGGLIIGLGRVALGHKFFFSQEESTRANDFKKHLRDSNFNNEGLLHGDFSPENRNPG